MKRKAKRQRTPRTESLADPEERLREASARRATSPALSGGDVDADWRRAESAGEEAVGGMVTSPIRTSSMRSAGHSAWSGHRTLRCVARKSYCTTVIGAAGNSSATPRTRAVNRTVSHPATVSEPIRRRPANPNGPGRGAETLRLLLTGVYVGARCSAAIAIAGGRSTDQIQKDAMR
jgi:hypothetical protein